MARIAFVYALIAVLAWGLAPIFDKILKQGLSSWTAVFLRTIVVMVIITIAAIHSGALVEIREMFAQGEAAHGEGNTPVPAWLIIVAAIGSAMLAGLIGQVAYYHALGHADASRVVPITAAYPMVAALAAIALFREPITVPKLAGTMLIVAGIILVSGVFNSQSEG
ncbi:MAG: EamA family transporter [Armatimonadota bacterium]|jgi:transporter family protein